MKRTKLVKNQKGFTVVEGLLIILILVVMGGIGYMVYHNNHKTKPVGTASTSTQKAMPATSASTNSQATENTDNTARANDATSLLTAFNNYVNNNQSDPPSTITAASSNSAYLCDPGSSTSCDSTNSSVVNLDFYKPQDISIVPGAQKLSAPDDNTVYIAGSEACTNKQSAHAIPDAASYVVLYALQNGSEITQECLSSS